MEVVAVNDITSPAALAHLLAFDVDRAKSVVVIKRSMGHGYPGVDNELYTDPKTGMFFTDAKKGLAELKAAVREFVSCPPGESRGR